MHSKIHKKTVSLANSDTTNLIDLCNVSDDEETLDGSETRPNFVLNANELCWCGDDDEMIDLTMLLKMCRIGTDLVQHPCTFLFLSYRNVEIFYYFFVNHHFPCPRRWVQLGQLAAWIDLWCLACLPANSVEESENAPAKHGVICKFLEFWRYSDT